MEKKPSRWRQKKTQLWQVLRSTIEILTPLFILLLIIIILIIAHSYDPIKQAYDNINDKILNPSDTILNIVVSAGFVAFFVSFLWWWYLQHLAPKIQFYPYILKWSEKYRTQFWNAGFRDIIDVEVAAKVLICGLDQYRSGNLSWYDVPLKNYKWSFLSEGGVKYRFIQLLPKEIRPLTEHSDWATDQAKLICKALKGKHVLPELNNVNIEQTDGETLQAILIRDSDLLKHLLILGSDAALEIIISGTDNFSGTKKIFRQMYNPGHIHEQPNFLQMERKERQSSRSFRCGDKSAGE